TQFPGTSMFFSTGGIVKRILTFGAPAPIDVEIRGYDFERAASHARLVASKLRALVGSDGKPLLSDVQISREENYPELNVHVDREKAGAVGISEQQVAQTVLASLVGSAQLTPIQFTDPNTGYEYLINVRLREEQRDRVSDLSEVFLRTQSGGMV